MATLICIALAAFFIIGLCIRMRVKIRLRVARGQSNARLELRFFYSLIRLRVRLVLFYRRGEKLELVRLKRTGERKVVFPKAEEDESSLSKFFKNLPLSKYKSWLKLKKLHSYLKLGAGEAYTSVMLCALFNNLIKQLCYVFFYDDKPEVTCEAVPDFENNSFILNMEGIITLHHVKIILATLKEFVKLKKRSGKGASK